MNSFIKVRISPVEKEKLRQIAEKHGLSVSEVIRRAVFGLKIEDTPLRPVVPEINRQLYLELAKINQYLDEMSNTQLTELEPQWLRGLTILLAEVRLELLGLEGNSI
jgi:antitoxin component of RelBE/YafQ-DinJ toxin-antitoxin module